MMMIIMGHTIVGHDTTYTLDDSSEVIRLLFGSFTMVAVNAYILISGYFGIHFKKERVFKLIFQTFFYAVLMLGVSIWMGWHTFDFKEDFYIFLPILTKQYWFVTCYFVLYVISPWLNFFADSLDKKRYEQMLLVGFFIVYVWPTFSYMLDALQFIGDNGYGIVNFTYLYFLGRYLKKHYTKVRTSSYYFVRYVLSALCLFGCQCFLTWLYGFEFSSWLSYNTFFIFIGSVCFFMTFRTMKSFHSSFINYWAQPCLAVYLIHNHPMVWKGLFNDLEVSNYVGFSYVILLFVLPLVMYFVCALFEIIRLKVFGRLEDKVIYLFN